jgi:secreted PhoX family phosphatase
VLLQVHPSITAYSKSARQTRGTHNNCGNGYTPWGTYLTTEENFIGYFARSATDDTLRRQKKSLRLTLWFKSEVQALVMAGKQ